MQSKFYSPDAHRAAQVNKLFATIARRYDLLNDVMTLGLHRHWKRRLVKLAGQPRDVLDLCCGTGDLALRFLWSAGPRVVGADFTREMLRVAATRSQTIHVASATMNTSSGACTVKKFVPQWVQADALGLPFPDNSFDVITVGYGLRNLADIKRGLREMYRVLRPGGKLLSLDFGKPESRFLRRMFFGHLRFHLPLMGRWSCGDPDAYAYILASLEAYPAQRGVKELMEQSGYRDCGFEEFLGGTMAINFGSKGSRG